MDLKEYLIQESVASAAFNPQLLHTMSALFLISVCVLSVSDFGFLKSLFDGDDAKREYKKKENEIGGIRGMLSRKRDKKSSSDKKKDYIKKDDSSSKNDDSANAPDSSLDIKEEDAENVAKMTAITAMADKAIDDVENDELKTKYKKIVTGVKCSMTDNNGDLLKPEEYSGRFEKVNGFKAEDVGNKFDVKLDNKEEIDSNKSILNKGIRDWFRKTPAADFNENVINNAFIGKTFSPEMEDLNNTEDTEESKIKIYALNKETAIRREEEDIRNVFPNPDDEKDQLLDKQKEISSIHNAAEKKISKLEADKSGSSSSSESETSINKEEQINNSRDEAIKTINKIEQDISLSKDEKAEKINKLKNDWEEGTGKDEEINGKTRRIFRGIRGGRYYKIRGNKKVYVEGIDLRNYLKKCMNE